MVQTRRYRYGGVYMKPHKRPFPQLHRVSSGRQAAVNRAATRYRPQSQPPEPEMVRRRRRFGTDSDGQAERCRAAPIQVAAARRSEG